MDYAHIFRRDRVNHVVLTSRANIRRNGHFHTVCAKRVDDSFQRRVSSATVSSPVTCEKCSRFMVALHDIVEADDENQRRGIAVGVEKFGN